MSRLDRYQFGLFWLGAMAGCAFAAGCSAPVRTFADANPTARQEPSIAQLVEQRQAAERLEPAHEQYPQAKYGPPTATEAQAVKPASAAPTIQQTEQLGESLSELVRQGAIDAETQTQLLDGLKQTDPALWPQLLTYFKAAASRKSLAAASGPPSGVQLASLEQAVPDHDFEPPSKPAAHAAEEIVKPGPKTETASAAETSGTSKFVKETKPAEEPKPVEPSTEKQEAGAEDQEPPKKTLPADSDLTWQQPLQTSIARLEKETQSPPATHDEIGRHAVLRMLYLAAGRREDALRPIAGIPAAHQDFWSKELYGLAAFMDHERNPDASRRAAEARGHLCGAAARLGELATLQVCNLTCCREVSSYGVYKPFETSEFHPGQELLLYAEIENFKSEHTDLGYHTALKASYQILDERGARVDEKEFALTEECCQNPRHDFFVRYFIWLPQKIYGGTYTLQLSVEDTLSQKIGQASVQFTIKPQS